MAVGPYAHWQRGRRSTLLRRLAVLENWRQQQFCEASGAVNGRFAGSGSHADRGDDLCGKLPADRLGNLASGNRAGHGRSEEHTSELQSLMRISYAVFCLNKTK